MRKRVILVLGTKTAHGRRTRYVVLRDFRRKS